MRVLSLFNGLSCGRVALERAEIPVERYVSYEIDEYANTIAKHNYPNDDYYGDVFQGDFTQYKGFDLLLGGSPCTHWSVCQKPDRRETSASGMGWDLFMQYVRALRESECKYFIYENNYSIHKDIQSAITKELGVYPIMINSALLSAQQRKRLYWTNIPNVEQPTDKGILLKDILESGLAHKEKSYCITANENKGVPLKYYLEKHKRQQVFEPVIYQRRHGYNKGGIKRDKSPTLTANGSWQDNNHVLTPIRIGNVDTTAKDKNSQQYRVYSVYGKSINLCGNGGGMGSKTGLYKIDLPDGDYIVRKLTPIECERLQTKPQDYTKYGLFEDGVVNEISATQRYKGLGNGWTVDIIAHMLKYLTDDKPKSSNMQMTLFDVENSV